MSEQLLSEGLTCSKLVQLKKLSIVMNSCHKMLSQYAKDDVSMTMELIIQLNISHIWYIIYAHITELDMVFHNSNLGCTRT